jgi:hypothetical protein
MKIDLKMNEILTLEALIRLVRPDWKYYARLSVGSDQVYHHRES